MRAVKEMAYAKINLYLDVTARRTDGFHDVKTVMHTLSLADAVTVRAKNAPDRRITMKIRGSHILPFDSKNIAYQAAMAYLEAAGIYAHVEIELEKNIPIAAGLAGGSTDAAAVLRAMNRIFNRHFSKRALLTIAAKMGSDVAYCLVGRTMLCQGRGEIMTEIGTSAAFFAVVAIADEHVSTPLAYRALDEFYSNFDGSVKSEGEEHYTALISALESGKAPDILYNIFESVIFSSCPKAGELKRKMIELGAKASLMSGSGPSVFGIFETAEAAISAKNELLKLGYRAYSCQSI